MISEKTLHPTGVDFPMKDIRTGNGFSSATDSYDTVSTVDQINRKLQAELKTLRERNTSYEEEIAEQKGIIDKLRKDLVGSKEEYHSAVQEGLAYKQRAHKTEVELKGAREQEQMLTEQVSQGV